jgi:indole-3-glycerol phosphate synthase
MRSYPVLDQIVARVRERTREDRRSVSESELLAGARVPGNFRAAFVHPGVNVIAEIKRASPSEGTIAPGADPVAVAGSYLRGGARAISVLTERDSFGGSLENLRRVRAANPETPLLMKDFIVDPYQLAQAVSAGADAVLLMVSVLGEEISRYLDLAQARGLTALVEVHDEDEMEIATAAGATLIGVNNRNLRTMEVSLATSERLIASAPPSATLITESGIKTAADIARLRTLGYRGFLVGTTLMRSSAPETALRNLIGETK